MSPRSGIGTFAGSLLLALLPTPALSHGGGLDSLGCHRDRKLGGYHCHKGPLAGRYFASKAEALSALRLAQTAPELAPTKREQLAVRWRLVKRVIDGDTIELDGAEKVRLIGVYTPETVHPEKPVQRFGQEASNCRRRVGGERK